MKWNKFTQKMPEYGKKIYIRQEDDESAKSYKAITRECEEDGFISVEEQRSGLKYKRTIENLVWKECDK